MYDKIAADAVWKRLSTDHKKYLKDQLVKVISKTQINRETIFVNGDVARNKFYQHWLLERMIMSALSTDRTASHNKAVAMARLNASLTAMRAATQGRAAWLDKDIRYVKRTVGARRGRPSLAGHLYDEETDDNDNDDDSIEIDAE
ncbi:hypothetical protein NCC49_000791 [Naganishia albida]|nr:hypothetical protein NCC49_000791 [Naganishia albida]